MHTFVLGRALIIYRLSNFEIFPISGEKRGLNIWIFSIPLHPLTWGVVTSLIKKPITH